MAINWPSLGQGAGTGATYTAPSPGRNVWTWSGYAWGSTGTTSTSGGYGAPWVIFDQYGRATAFRTLVDAIAYSNFGDYVETIHLFQNITEYAVDTDLNGNYVVFGSYVNINLNGHTYTIDSSTSPIPLRLLTNFGNEVDVKIYNGKIISTNCSEDTILICEVLNLSVYFGCNWKFENVTFLNTDLFNGAVGKFYSSVTGGIFDNRSVNGYGVDLNSVFGTNKKLIIFKDCIGYSIGGDGISFRGFTDGVSNKNTTLCINCKGYTNSSNSVGISVLNENYTTSNRHRLINCSGFNNKGFGSGNGESNSSSGIYTLGRSTLIKCQGISISGHGIKSYNSTLIHCNGEGGRADGGGSAFYSNGMNLFKNCTTSQNNEIDMIQQSIGIFVDSYSGNGVILNDYVDNCNLCADISILVSDTTTGTGSITVSNSELRYFYRSIYSAVEGFKTNVYNSSIICKSKYIQSPAYNTITSNGNYSAFTNNVILGPGAWDVGPAFSTYGTTGRTFYIGNNTTQDYSTLLIPAGSVGGVIQGMIAVKDGQGNIQQDIIQ